MEDCVNCQFPRGENAAKCDHCHQYLIARERERAITTGIVFFALFVSVGLQCVGRLKPMTPVPATAPARLPLRVDR